MKRLSIIFAPLLALLLIVTPAVSAHASILPKKITIRDENEMGRNFDRLIRMQMGMVGDTYITDYVDTLVQRIVAAKRPMPFTITSAVVANPILNAFAIPGGYIYIFTGLIQEVESESQLAGVIAHELAHVSQRHMASRLEKQGKIGMLSVAGMLAGVFLGMAGGGDAAQAVMMGTQGLAHTAMLKYSQDDEREADHVGLNSMVKAGYNPEGMPQTFEIMMKNRWFDSGANIPSYLSTHPGLTERISYLNDRISRMPPAFGEREDNDALLKRLQPMVRAKMSPANTALAYFNNKPKAEYSAMDYIGLGIAHQRLKDNKSALASFQKALEMDANDPLVSRETGIFFFKTGQHDKAFPYLQKAVIQNSRDALGLFYLSRLQADAGQSDRAIANMKKVLDLVPEDAEVHQHLGRMLGQSGDVFSGNLHLAYAAMYSGNIKKANYHAVQAEKDAKSDEQKKRLEDFQNTLKERTADT
ncbi:Peptidase M48 Ste24p [Pseudodesulfovibrio profundus]|uniref:Peptidase M48 Ste24p n=1 Tax=Pseudodesulfovibrio profundus TaxID=57320 RepID=A0A2C8FDP9_9BACT|nr:M48 family metallopeptidase [Pseudodesulfovibrio profundus]MBC17151.1 peptidase M48 [Desulfovibrio sp.]SOB60585.1 Peptidase M48 Ste24p [Pseudodesulfovibrio profundus]